MSEIIILNTLFIILFLCSNIAVKVKMPRELDYAIFLGVVLVYLLLMAFRQDVPDVINYKEAYEHLQNGKLRFGINEILQYGIYGKPVQLANMEMGYLLINKIFAMLGFSFEAYNFVVGSIELYIIFKYGRKVLNNFEIRIGNKFSALLGLIVFYGLYYQFIAFRQGMIISLGVVACAFAVEKKWSKAILVLLILPAIHFSGLVFVLLIPILLAPKHPKRKLVFILWTAMAIVIFTGSENTATNSLNTVLPMVSEYSVTVANYRHSFSKIGVYSIRILYLLILFVLLLAKERESKYWNIIDIILVGSLMMVTLGGWDIINRVYDIFFFFFFVSIGYVLLNKDVKMLYGTTQLCRLVLILLFIARIIYSYRVLGYA